VGNPFDRKGKLTQGLPTDRAGLVSFWLDYPLPKSIEWRQRRPGSAWGYRLVHAALRAALGRSGARGLPPLPRRALATATSAASRTLKGIAIKSALLTLCQ